MNIPRQPFLGLALMAALGIGVAGFFPIAASQWWLSAIIFAVLAIPLLCWPNFTSTYLLVGFVTSEPKVAPNGFATFLFSSNRSSSTAKTMMTRLSRKWATALIIPLLLFYAAVTGLHVSSIRAAVMSSILLGGFFFERKVFALNSLAAAAFFLLCWNTNEFFSTGFQLSFAVVGGIILLADPLSEWLRPIGAPDPFLRRRLVSGLRRMIGVGYEWICRGGSVSLAAWLGSLPLIIWYFHLVTPSSLFANLVVVPIAFFILAIALLSLVVAPIASGLSLIFNNANWTLATAVIAFIQWFAQVPGSHYYVAEPGWPKKLPAKITVLDIGAGAAVHVRASRPDWLLDCGSGRDYERVLRSCLHGVGIK